MTIYVDDKNNIKPAYTTYVCTHIPYSHRNSLDKFNAANTQIQSIKAYA